MDENENEGISRKELDEEFNLDRMILFSDAVFAVVITLMAIEIKLPDSMESVNDDYLAQLFNHLWPAFTAYVVSYIFIGSVWYRHLKIFKLLKSYDKGLVVRNLVLLFFIGLFPFGASIITRVNHSIAPFGIYTCIMVACVGAQYALHYYILKQRPQLRNQIPAQEFLEQLKQTKKLLIILLILVGIIPLSWWLIPNQNLKPLAILWLALLPIFQKLMSRKKENPVAKVPVSD